jgi:hypothetical protein
MDPHPPATFEAATPADLITPHADADADPAPAGEADADLTPGIVDRRRSRLGPEALEPPAPSLPPPDATP